MKLKKTNKQQAFTLIELLVVIAIIGLLASIVLVALSNARQKARIAKRMADLKSVQTALELYYNDYNTYPNPGWGWRSQCQPWGNYAANNVIPGLIPTYMQSMPADPSMNTGGTNCYLYLSNGTDYKFLDYNLTNMTTADLQNHPDFKDPPRSYTTNPPCAFNGDLDLAMSVYTTGGACW